jgi:hypothetical protein
MIPRLEHFAQLVDLLHEVDVLEGRVRRVTAADGDDEREPSGKRPLRVPGHPARRDAAVDEHQARPATHDFGVH